MKMLFADTCLNICRLAVVENGMLLNVQEETLKSSFEKVFFVREKLLLNEAKMRLQDIDLFVCINGPGSYTGTRIAVSSFKTQAYAVSKPLFTISSLQSIFLSATMNKINDKKMSLVLLNAGNERCFFQIFINSLPYTEHLTADLHEIDNLLLQLLEKCEIEYLEILGDFPFLTLKNAERNRPYFISLFEKLTKNHKLDKLKFLYENKSYILDNQEFLTALILKLQICVQKFSENPLHLSLDYCQLYKYVEKQVAKASEKQLDPFAAKVIYSAPSQAERLKNKVVNLETSIDFSVN